MTDLCLQMEFESAKEGRDYLPPEVVDDLRELRSKLAPRMEVAGLAAPTQDDFEYALKHCAWCPGRKDCRHPRSGLAEAILRVVNALDWMPSGGRVQ